MKIGLSIILENTQCCSGVDGDEGVLQDKRHNLTATTFTSLKFYVDSNAKSAGTSVNAYNFLNQKPDKKCQLKNDLEDIKRDGKLDDDDKIVLQDFIDNNICQTETTGSSSSSTPTSGNKGCDGDTWYKFKDANNKETCLCYWKQVRELVNGDVDCYDSLKVTIQDDRLGLGKPTPRKVTRYRVSANCVKTYNTINPKYINGGYPITVEQSHFRRPGEEPQVQRISGSNQPQRRQQQPAEITPPQTSTETKKPNFTKDEEYILGLFKD